MQSLVKGKSFAMNVMSAVAAMPRRAQHTILAMTALTVVSVIGTVAGAFAVPAVGSFGYDVYDLVVNQILGGAIGFVGALCLIVWGATKLTTNWMITIMCVIAGTIIIKASAIVATLGAMVA